MKRKKLKQMDGIELWIYGRRRRHHNKDGRRTIKLGNNRWRLKELAKEIGTKLL